MLTAAHCVDAGKKPADLEVVIGDTNLSDAIDPAETHGVDQIARHPKWGGDPGDRNDVALLHLTADSAIAPVRLGTSTALVKGVKRCFNQMTMAVVRQRIWTPGSCLASPGTGLGWGRTPSSGGSTLLTLRESGARVLDFPLGTFWRVKSGACPATAAARCSSAATTAPCGRSASPATPRTAADGSTGSSGTAAAPGVSTSTPTCPAAP